MSRGVRWFIVGSGVLVTLAGCGRGILQYAASAQPWRREAEVACLNSGTVKEGAGLVRISPIEGPGMCGADFPLKVSALGEGPALGYVDEPVRPPGHRSRARAVRRRSRAGRSRSSHMHPAPPPQRSPARRCRSKRPASRSGRIRSSRCSARRRPICRRRRIGSAADRQPHYKAAAAAPPHGAAPIEER